MADALRLGPYEPDLHYQRILQVPKNLLSTQINPFWQKYILPRFGNRIKCDLIHIHTCYNLAYGAVLAGKKIGVPIVATIRREQEMPGLPVRRVRLLSEAMKQIDVIISPSAHLANKCRQANGCEVHVIPSGTDIIFDEKASVNPERKRRVLFVGTLEANKGILPLVNAAVRLFKSGCNFELFIIGQGPLLAELKSMVAGFPQVRFLGQIESIAVRQQMREAQVLCAPSYTETLGLVFIEAMKQAMAVIGRKNTGIDGMGTAGRDYEVIEKDDDLAETLWALLDDDSRRIEIAANGQRLAAKWTWENSALQHMAIYEELVRKAT
jgi:glycosyltransferase involved in cell wall biosynthesis